MHKEFLDGLRNIANVKLVAKYKNKKIGFPYNNRLRIFIPDLHLYSKSSFEKNRYTARTNYIDDLLPSLVQYLARFKKESENADKEVVVYQVGDFLDPWRETPVFWAKDPGKYAEAIDRIIKDNPDVWNELTDAETINTRFVLGNHDIDIYHIPRLAHLFGFLRLFIEDKDEKVVAAVMHGDLFSWFEKVAPDWMQQLAVYYFSPKKLKEKNPKLFDEVKKNADSSAKEDLDNDEGEIAGDLGDLIDPDEAPEDEWNVKRPGSAEKEELDLLDPAREYYQEVNQRLDYEVRTTFVGHTHRARIAVYDEKVPGNDTFFLLVDSGGWVKNFTANFVQNGQKTPINEKKAQLGVLCNNEVRVYQFSKK
jgi:UDP-2,3-diacylglucosamine pyrophosphatase LpxH